MFEKRNVFIDLSDLKLICELPSVYQHCVIALLNAGWPISDAIAIVTEKKERMERQ